MCPWPQGIGHGKRGEGGICDDVPSTAALVIYTYKVVLDTVFYLIRTEATAITWDFTIKWVFSATRLIVCL